MGCPYQGNKAGTPVGYSHDTGVSTAGQATAVTGVVARNTPGVHRFVWGWATTLLAMRCMRCDSPWVRCTGLPEQPAGPGSGEVCKEDCDCVTVRWSVWWTCLGWRGDLAGAVMEGTGHCR